MKLTAVILNHLPARQLQPTLESVSFADEIIIIYDSRTSRHSGDESARTPESDSGIRVFTRSLNNFAAQRNFALTKVKTPWVLFLDSDEVVTPKLKQEIKKAIKQNKITGFYLNRRDVFYGQTLKYGETGSSKILRLALKNAGRFSRKVHESWKIKGRVGELKAVLLHRKKNLTSGFLERIGQYGPIDSQSLSKEGKPFSYFRLFFNPPAKFFQNYIVRLGIQDGLLGLFHAYLMSIQSLSVRIFQWQNNHL